MSQKKSIVVLGAGPGGFRTALSLDRLLFDRSDYEVVLVDVSADHQILPRLPEVAAGSITSRHASLPIRRMIGRRSIRFVQAEAQALDVGTSTVTTTAGPIEYWRLVVALGGVSAPPDIPGARAKAIPVRSLEAASGIASTLHERIRQAALKVDVEEKQRLATTVIVGAGFTGVEMAGGLAEATHDLAIRYRLASGTSRVILLEQGERVLPEYPRLLSDAVTEVLGRKRVDVRLGRKVVGVDDTSVTAEGGETIPCGTVIWAGGVTPAPAVAHLGLPTDDSGRIKVDPFLNVVGRDDVFALGDCAKIVGDDDGTPPSAQAAVYQADVVADNLYSEIVGRPRMAFRISPLDLALWLGTCDAVALVAGIVIGGPAAIALRKIAEARYLERIGGPGTLLSRLAGVV